MLATYSKGDVIPAKITHLEPFGAFADIGCGIVGLISIENISVSRISHPKDRFHVGQNILTVIKDIDKQQKGFRCRIKNCSELGKKMRHCFRLGKQYAENTLD